MYLWSEINLGTIKSGKRDSLPGKIMFPDVLHADSSQESSFREDVPSVASYARYQSENFVAEYCDAHYGPAKFGVTNFPEKIARLCLEAMRETSCSSALDLGCAVGRTSFELAVRFNQVTGIDYSKRFIDIACRIKKRGKLSYRLFEEGELISDHRVSLAELGLAETAEKVSFYQGNAQCLDNKFRNYDLVLAANLIDRLPNPAKFLTNIHKRVNPGGLLVIASPYNWLEHFTPRKNWLGGRFRCGSPVSSLKGISKSLCKHFEMIDKPRDIEFVIRETARIYNHGISQATVWRRHA